jgi:Ca-activated chloride channel family protein
MSYQVRGKVRSGAWVAAMCAVLAALAGLRQGSAQTLSSPQFRSDANLVLVPVTVTDARGSNIQGLGVERFTVLEDRQPQPIVAFYADDAPSEIGIVVDVSGSTKDILQQEKAAVRAFLEFSNPQDEFFLMTVSSKPQVQADRVIDPREIESLLQWKNSGGATALSDTVYLALHRTRLASKSRRALLVISDGMDNHSQYSKKEVLREVLESDTQIYTIGLNNPGVNVKGIPMAEVQRGLAFLDDLAETSGGLSVRLRSSDNPSAAIARISSAIRSQYVIGYRSPHSGQAEQWHRIQVKVDLHKANVYARSGYQLLR